MIMDNIAAVSLIVVFATILLPIAAVGLTLWMGGMNPPDEDTHSA